MPADRFELELREALRAESAIAPVTMSAAQLRERAGARPGLAWRVPGFGRPWLPTGAVIVVIALAAGLIFGPLRPGVGEPSASPSPSPSATSSASAPPSAASSTSAPASPVVLGSSGSAVVVRANGDRLDALEWRVDGTWRAIAAVPSLASVLGGWSFDGYHEIAVSDDGHLAIPVARGPAGARETRLAILDLARPAEPAVLLAMGSPAFLGDGTLVVLSAVEDGVVLRYAPPYTDAGVALALPSDVSVTGPAGNVTTPLSLLPDDAGLLGLRTHRDAAGQATWPDELVAITWDGSVREADPAVQPEQITGADRLVDHAGRSAFVQDPHTTPTPAFVAQAPAEQPVVVGSPAVTTNAWRPAGRELAFVDDGMLKVWDGSSSSRTIDPLPMPADGSFIAGFTEHAVLVIHDGTTWALPFGECLRCGGPSGHLDGLPVRVLP
ncbi:MAG TPA: hypothetical protein VH440_04635 [Candidatus Limnocylindrales bacterium]